MSVWEKCDRFKVVIDINDNCLKMPREGDKWIMQLFVRAGFNKEDLLRLIRVRVHQQVLFLSCVFVASGKSLDKKYMTKRKPEEKWSTLRFPKENPPNKDFQLWRMALRQIVPAGGIPYRLGLLTNKGYKIWNWRWDLEGKRLIHFKGEVMDDYRPSSLPRMINVVNRWTRTRIGQETEQGVQVCTIREVELAVVAVVSNTDPPREEIMPTKIKEVLKEWGMHVDVEVSSTSRKG